MKIQKLSLACDKTTGKKKIVNSDPLSVAGNSDIFNLNDQIVRPRIYLKLKTFYELKDYLWKNFFYFVFTY